MIADRDNYEQSGGIMGPRVRVYLALGVCLSALSLAWGLAGGPMKSAVAAEQPTALRPQARPVGLVFLHAAQRLLVANRDSATITTIDPATQKVLSTWKVPGGEQLADFIASDDGQYLLTCSVTQNKVWLIQRMNDQEFAVVATVDVPAGPVGLNWLPVGAAPNAAVTVACQWGRAVVFLKFSVPSSSSLTW